MANWWYCGQLSRLFISCHATSNKNSTEFTYSLEMKRFQANDCLKMFHWGTRVLINFNYCTEVFLELTPIMLLQAHSLCKNRMWSHWTVRWALSMLGFPGFHPISATRLAFRSDFGLLMWYPTSIRSIFEALNGVVLTRLHHHNICCVIYVVSRPDNLRIFHFEVQPFGWMW